MEIRISKTIPAEWATKPGKSYDTRFMYLGFSRYDTEKKMLSKFTADTDQVMYSESPCETISSFSKGYHTELVKVTIYSETPRVWSEELGPGEIHFFVQQPTHVA